MHAACLCLAFLASIDRSVTTMPLQGEWIVQSDVWGGMTFGKGLKGATLVIKNDSYTAIGQDKKSREQGTLSIPFFGFIDITNQSGGVFPGIYRLKKNQIELCYALRPNQERPVNFKSSEASNTVLILLTKK